METQGHALSENSQVEKATLMVPETQNTPHVIFATIPRTQEPLESTSTLF